MFYKVAAAAGLALCLALPAVAAETSQSSSSGNTAEMGQPVRGMNTVSVRQHIVQDLEKAGYTNINVVPASFVAQAKDKEGQPVTMLISPDSITTIIQEPMSNKSASTQSTSGTKMAGSGASSNTAK